MMKKEDIMILIFTMKVVSLIDHFIIIITGILHVDLALLCSKRHAAISRPAVLSSPWKEADKRRFRALSLLIDRSLITVSGDSRRRITCQ